MTAQKRILLTIVLTATWAVSGCGGIKPTRFVNPDFDFGFIETVAVLPIQNLTQDRQAAERTTRILITELLATGAVDVVEPGDVEAAYDRIVRGLAEPTAEQLVTLGKELRVQGLILGSVTQSETVRSGTVSIPVVSMDLHMVESETGATVWAATHTERASGAGAKFLGTGTEPISETTRKAVRTLVDELVN